MFRVFRVVLLLLCAWAVPASATTTNGVWMSHNYVKYSSYVSDVPRVATFMRNNQVTYLFVNAGVLDTTGHITNSATELAQVKNFLNAIKTWETSNGYQFKVLAWISGDVDPANTSTYVDISSATIRNAIVDEGKKFVLPSFTGSYVSGANRAFDGVQMDLEPSGANDTLFNNLKTLMDSLKTGVGSGKLTSYAAHKYGTTNQYWWSPTYYHYMARRVDLICGMCYNSTITTSSAYRTWMRDQTSNICRAVSGAYWNNDASHPAPTNGVKVVIGFPAFPASSSHIVTAETVSAAALGTLDGTALLTSNGDSSVNYFAGASIFLYTNGTGSDGYSKESTDWVSWEHDWLGWP